MPKSPNDKRGAHDFRICAPRVKYDFYLIKGNFQLHMGK